VNYVIEDALRRAKDFPPRYYWMGGLVVLLLVVGLFVWWPSGAPKADAKTQAAVAALNADKEANVAPPAAEPAGPAGFRRKAVQAK
jgi:hypothetical protein